LLNSIISVIPKPLLKKIYFSKVGKPLAKVYLNVYKEKKLHRLPNGAMMNLSTGIPGELAILHNAFEPEITKFVLEKAKPGSVVVDVGSWNGYYAILAAGNGAARVLAIEIDSKNAAQISENVGLNGFQDVITLLSKAVGKSRQYGAIIPNKNESMLQVVPDTAGDLMIDTLDNIIAAEGIDVADLLIMDIEGDEAVAVEGMQGLLKLHKIKDLIIEMHPQYIKRHNRTFEEVIGLVSVNGYSVNVIKDDNPDTFHIHCSVK
jgi:FkbM family methyltransferase